MEPGCDENVIVCERLTHVYRGGVTALKDVDLTIRKGEVVGVIGQNGAGKTTLVKHFNGLLKPSAGRVLVRGVDTKNESVQSLSRHVGYVFQNPNHQLFAKTVRDDLAFGPLNLGMGADEVAHRVDEAVEFFVLHDVLDKHPYRLSFPLRKLVGLASIFTMKPEVFVLDEPTTGQDHKGVRLIGKLMQRLRDEGYTVVAVSHDMMLIAEYCDRVLVVGDGRILQDGPPQDVFADVALLRRTHLHPPQVTELSYRVRDELGTGPILTVKRFVEVLQEKCAGS
ncbi:MAG: energy-coupling factor ABC transporter ATP-binding protein [Betaproteobacteria bacterium]